MAITTFTDYQAFFFHFFFHKREKNMMLREPSVPCCLVVSLVMINNEVLKMKLETRLQTEITVNLLPHRCIHQLKFGRVENNDETILLENQAERKLKMFPIIQNNEGRKQSR